MGGGTVTSIALETDLVERSRWLTLQQYRTIFGLARLTPGTNILAIVAGVGWTLHGWRGVLGSLSSLVIPSAVLTTLFAAAYVWLLQWPMAQRFFAGAAAAVCGLLFVSILKVIQPYSLPAHRLETTLVLSAAAALAVYDIPPLPIMVLLALLGYWRGSRQ
jgi:chromate transporter